MNLLKFINVEISTFYYLPNATTKTKLYIRFNFLIKTLRDFNIMGLAELVGDDPSNELTKTFVFQGEGHTLGTALRSVISRYPEVTFCGYSVPYPADDYILFRIQSSGPKPIDILKKGFADLEEHCKYISNVFKKSVLDFKPS